MISSRNEPPNGTHGYVVEGKLNNYFYNFTLANQLFAKGRTTYSWRTTPEFGHNGNEKVKRWQNWRKICETKRSQRTWKNRYWNVVSIVQGIWTGARQKTGSVLGLFAILYFLEAANVDSNNNRRVKQDKFIKNLFINVFNLVGFF